MIGFYSWIKGYCRFSACKLGVFRSVYLYTPCPKLQLETFTEGTNMTSVYLSSGLVNNKGTDLPAHLLSLISAFVFR